MAGSRAPDDGAGEHRGGRYADEYAEYADEYVDEYADEYDEGGAVLYDDGEMRPSRRPLYIGIVALVVVAAAVIAFVATRKDEEPPATFSLAAAAANAGAAERVAYDLSARLDGQTVTAATGVLDLRTGSQQLDASARTAADGAASVAPTSFVLDAAARSVYVESTAFASVGLLFERPYVRIDIGKLADGVEVDTVGLLAQYGGNPLAVVPLLGRTPAQDLGAETIAGEQVEHFRVQLAIGDLLEASPALSDFLRIDAAAADTTDTTDATDSTATTDPADASDSTAATDPTAAQGATGVSTTGSRVVTTAAAAPGAGAASGAAAASGDAAAGDAATAVVDVYVTEDNVLRRLVFVTSVPGSAIGTVTFTEYDGDAHVVVPPSDQVISLADAFGR